MPESDDDAIRRFALALAAHQQPVPAHVPGEREPGNVNVYAQPTVPNGDGTSSTVDSISVGLDNDEVLLPRVTPDGRHLSNAEALVEYFHTGRHLGKFDTPAHADQRGARLHDEYAAGQYAPPQPVPSHLPNQPMPFIRASTPDEAGWGRAQDRADWVAQQPLAKLADAVGLPQEFGLASFQDAADYFRSHGPHSPATVSGVVPGGTNNGRMATMFETGEAVAANTTKHLANADKLVSRNPQTMGEWLTWHSSSGSPSVYKLAAPRLNMPLSYEQLSAVRDKIGPSSSLANQALRKLTPAEFLKTPLGREVRKVQTTIAPAAVRAPAPPPTRRYAPAQAETGLVWRPNTKAAAALTIDVVPSTVPDPDALVSLPGRPMYVPYKGGKVYVAQHDVEFLKREREFLAQMKRVHSDMVGGELGGTDARLDAARKLNLAREKWLAERKSFYKELGVDAPDRKLMSHLPRAPEAVTPATEPPPPHFKRDSKEYKAEQAARTKAAWTPERKAKAAAFAKEQNNARAAMTPEEREAMDQKWREKMQAHWTPERRAEFAARSKVMNAKRYGKETVKEDAPAFGGVALAKTQPRTLSSEGWAKLAEGFDARAHKGLSNLHTTLHSESFQRNLPRDRAIETMGAMESVTGFLRGKVLHGEPTYVDIPEEVIWHWSNSPQPVSTAHTHPASSAFSLIDLMGHMKMQENGVDLHSMLVFGRDGSWYDLRWPKQAVDMDARRALIYEHGRQQAAAAERANTIVDDWIKAKGIPFTPDSRDGRMFWRRPDGSGVSINELRRMYPEIDEFHETQFRNESVKIWEALAPLFNGTFRYHLAPR